MYIQSEKELEEYIIKNNKYFMNVLKDIYETKEEIKFVGNQVRLGNIICDMLYYFDSKIIDSDIEYTTRNFIIIENKFRQAEPKDIAQISKYMATIRDKIGQDYPYLVEVYGIIVSLGCNLDMQNVLINDALNNIKMLSADFNIGFYEESWSFKDEYINNTKLDDRLLKVLGEE